jgi:hypothetical protein
MGQITERIGWIQADMRKSEREIGFQQDLNPNHPLAKCQISRKPGYALLVLQTLNVAERLGEGVEDS